MHGQITQGDHADELLAPVQDESPAHLVRCHPTHSVRTSWASNPETMSGVITSRSWVVRGSRPAATARTVLSRSVSMPTRRSPS
jgi:hypothetical protein